VDATPFGHYQLQKLIGRGGMGEVYRVYDTKTDRIIDLKVLPHHLAEELAPAGEIFDTAPYGWPVAKGSGLGESLRRALELLMQTGEYRTIATLWGVEKGMIGKPVINGAVR
jgi:serine/threonine protein kinase